MLCPCRCHLPSGKTIWLCKGHQNIDRITVFSSNAGADALLNMIDDDGANFDASEITANQPEAEKPVPAPRSKTSMETIVETAQTQAAAPKPAGRENAR